MTTAVLSRVTKAPFSTVKVVFDIALVALTAAFAWFTFGLLTGNGFTVVIREGTLLLAFLTGICMRFTDPLMDRLFAPLFDSIRPLLSFRASKASREIS